MTQSDVEDRVLAIHGGTPVRATPLPYGQHWIEDEDIEAVVQTLRSDWITTGPKVAEFEEAIAARVGARYAVTFSSGTAALHGAAFAAGLGPGEEAVTTPLTFCATANCVAYMGATPLFSDISADTLNIDPELIESHITHRTRAILPVDYAGRPAELDRILAIAEEHGLIVIEDAAHALGAEYKGRPVGSLSHLTMFSFHPVKHITTGEGGLIATDNPQYARRLRLFRNHGIDPEERQQQRLVNGQWYYEMQELGFNYRLPDIACALGLSQLKRLSDNISRRREIADCYNQAFATLPGVVTPGDSPEARSVWHLYSIRLELERLSAGRKEVFQALRAENIEVNVHYIPVTWHPYYRKRFGYRGGEFPVAEATYDSLITLPLFASMTPQDINDVIAAVQKVITHYLIDT